MLSARDAEEALALFEGSDVDVVITDVRMPGRDGVYLLSELRDRDPAVAVILITGYGTIDVRSRGHEPGGGSITSPSRSSASESSTRCGASSRSPGTAPPSRMGEEVLDAAVEAAPHGSRDHRSLHRPNARAQRREQGPGRQDARHQSAHDLPARGKEARRGKTGLRTRRDRFTAAIGRRNSREPGLHEGVSTHTSRPRLDSCTPTEKYARGSLQSLNSQREDLCPHPVIPRALASGARLPTKSTDELLLRPLATPPVGFPSKLLYDARGSELFEAICKTPEYYITRVELDIMSQPRRPRWRDTAGRAAA